MILKRCLAASMFILAASVQAQQMETNTDKYLRPLVMVKPSIPRSILREKAIKRYMVRLEINADGTARLPVVIEPEDAEFRVELEKVLPDWRFYPDVDRDCKPAPRTGRLGIEVDGSQDWPKVWAEFPAVSAFDPSRIRRRSDGSPPPPEYPWRERRRGLQGDVEIVMKLMPDGSTREHVVLTAVPPAPGFIETALQHAAAFRGKPDDRPDGDPFICVSVPYGFRLMR